MSAPNDIMRSTYSFPSTSKTCDPRPRSRTTGPGENTAAPREGEFTPSTNDRCARSKYCADRVRDLEVKRSKILKRRFQIVDCTSVPSVQSSIRNPQSEICNQKSAIGNCTPHPET